jgi:hypothetical protein
MDGYQFIASLVQSVVSLAWPAALVVAVWLFREKITALLPLLRFKYKDLDVSFRLDQAEKEANALKPAEGADVAPPTPEETDKFQRLVKLSPRSAVLERSLELESALEAFATEVGIPANQYRGMLALTRELRKYQLIDHATSALLDDLRAIRNSAAHSGTAEISEQDALRFGELANKAIFQIRIAANAAEMLKVRPLGHPTISP